MSCFQRLKNWNADCVNNYELLSFVWDNDASGFPMENLHRAEEKCNPVEVGLKSFFLELQAENASTSLNIVQDELRIYMNSSVSL